MSTEATRQEIIRAAREAGLDPATAQAYAERESSFNPQARNSKTIRGLYQMRGDNRAKYGVPDDADVATQTKGFAAFLKDVKKEMAGPLGREPTDAEAYAGHHFGGKRAGRMMSMDPSTPVDAVFTPREMAENPHFAKAGTVGALTSSVIGDIDRRRTTFGGTSSSLPDLSSFGEPVQTEAPDLSSFGDPVEQSQPAPSMAAPSAPDLSQFGTPA